MNEGTMLWTTTFLDGTDKSGSYRLARTHKWITYHMRLRNQLGFSRIFLLDNASSTSLSYGTPGIEFMQFNERLTGSGDSYPYCWRAVYHMSHILATRKIQKLIYIDNDGFVLSKKMADWIRDANTGWQTVWCKKYNFPEASIQIINEDAFPLFMDFTKGHYMEHCGKKMELVLPFTHVNKDLNCDRYGEDRVPPTKDMDFYSQCPVDIEMRYEND